jgi:hypothetical protein
MGFLIRTPWILFNDFTLNLNSNSFLIIYLEIIKSYEYTYIKEEIL